MPSCVDYPDKTIPRRNTGYALDDLLYGEPFTPGAGRMVNLARLIAGSEGTLAIVTEAKLGLVPLPPPVKALDLCSPAHPQRCLPGQPDCAEVQAMGGGADGQQHFEPGCHRGEPEAQQVLHRG